MTLPLQTVEAHESVQQNFDAISSAWPEPLAGTGTPNTFITGGPGAQYTDLATGQRWTHEAAVFSNVGWVLK